MDRDYTLKDTNIDMDDAVVQVEIPLLEQYGTYSKDNPGISMKEQTGNRDEKSSPHKDVEVLIKDRDCKGINNFLKVTFEDVIAEPASVHSFDKVWLWNHALFEVCRLWLYRSISLLLAVPVALSAGLLFSLLSFLHIWLIIPALQLLLINMHWLKVVWASVLDLAISPFFFSLGRFCGSTGILWTKD